MEFKIRPRVCQRESHENLWRVVLEDKRLLHHAVVPLSCDVHRRQRLCARNALSRVFFLLLKQRHESQLLGEKLQELFGSLNVFTVAFKEPQKPVSQSWSGSRKLRLLLCHCVFDIDMKKRSIFYCPFSRSLTSPGPLESHLQYLL